MVLLQNCALTDGVILQWYEFKFPIALSMVHMVASAIGSVLVIRMGGYAVLDDVANFCVLLLLLRFCRSVLAWFRFVFRIRYDYYDCDYDYDYYCYY